MRRHRLAAAALILVAPWGELGATPVPASPSFDHVFSAAGEPAALHYEVAFVSSGRIHHMAVWRDGDRRVKRVTDGVLVTLGMHRPGDPGYTLTVFDLQRRTSTRIDRTSLYRVGNFTDWFDLTHGLRHPKAAYTLVQGDPPKLIAPMVARCRWYVLSESGRSTRLCWDNAARLPLAIVAGNGRPVWQVTALDTRPVPSATFTVDDRGFVHNDASRDIAGD